MICNCVQPLPRHPLQRNVSAGSQAHDLFNTLTASLIRQEDSVNRATCPQRFENRVSTYDQVVLGSAGRPGAAGLRAFRSRVPLRRTVSRPLASARRTLLRYSSARAQRHTVRSG
jgi:hypothetical protein